MNVQVDERSIIHRLGLTDCLTVALSITTFVIATSCVPEPDIIENERLDIWCSENELCSWENDGKIRRVGTWHANDYGVNLDGSNVVLSQIASDVSGCLFFYSLVDIDSDVRVTLELDIFDDGVSEYTHKIIGQDFDSVHFDLLVPKPAPNTRVIIRKKGASRAVLAEFFVDAKNAECTSPPFDFELRAIGDPCASDSWCDSGMCAVREQAERGICDDCSLEAACDEALLACIEGEEANCFNRHLTCLEDDKTENGVCSECLGASDCEENERCALDSEDDYFVCELR
jgi:hypothetical protein